MKQIMLERMIRALARAGTIGFLLALVPGNLGLAQTLYSYINENGVRVLTNIPPKNAVAPPMPAAQGTVDQNRISATADAVSPKAESLMPVLQGAEAAPYTPVKPESAATKYDPIIEKYASEYHLDPSLVRSIIAIESNFNPKAVSSKGARGLMQLMPGTASRLGVQNLHDAEENIRGGMKYLRTLLDTFDNDLTLSLAAYNAGESLVQRIGRIPNFPETHAYVRSVQKRYGKKEMQLSPSAEERRGPSLFRYVDAQGILHLTDKPPLQRSDLETLAWAPGGQSPE